MIFNDRNKKQIEEEFRKLFKILAPRYGNNNFFISEEVNIPLFANIFIESLEKSNLIYLIKEEDFNKINISIESKKPYNYLLTSEDNRIICKLTFHGMYIDILKAKSKYNFDVTIADVVNSTKRNSFKVLPYKNNYKFNVLSKIDKKIRILKGFYKNFDLEYPEIRIDNKIKNIDYLPINFNSKKLDYFTVVNSANESLFCTKNLEDINNIKPINFAYMSMLIEKNLKLTLNEFNSFLVNKRIFDKKLRLLENKTTGLQLKKLSFNYGSLNFNKFYIAIKKKINNNKIILLVGSDNFSIEEFKSQYIYLVLGYNILLKSEFTFDDYINNKDEVLNYLSLLSY